MDFELLAASLRADQGDAHAFLGALAIKLQGALPNQTVVERVKDGLFKSTTHVARISVDLPPTRYMLSIERGAAMAQRAKIVGGVVIKTESLTVDQWIESLAQALATQAQGSAAARAALERLLT